MHRFQELAIVGFNDLRNWAAPKMYRMRHIATAAKRIAASTYTNTDTQERTHQELTPSDAFNNHRPDSWSR
jgi:hypothetical protein